MVFRSMDCRCRRAERLKHPKLLFLWKMWRFGGGGGFTGFHENVSGVRELVGGGLQERRLLQHQWLVPVTNSCNAWTLVSASFSSREVPFWGDVHFSGIICLSPKMNFSQGKVPFEHNLNIIVGFLRIFGVAICIFCSRDRRGYGGGGGGIEKVTIISSPTLTNSKGSVIYLTN